MFSCTNYLESLINYTRISTLVLLRCTIHTEQYLSAQVTVTVIQDHITWILHYIPRLYVISDVSGHSHIIIQDINSTRLYFYIYWNFRISYVVKSVVFEVICREKQHYSLFRFNNNSFPVYHGQPYQLQSPPVE